MALTLDDIMAVPSDPEELQKHLIGKGLIPSPIETPPIVPPAQVGPLSPVTPHSDVAPMVPPKTDWLAKETGGIHPLHKEQQVDVGEAPPEFGLPSGAEKMPDVKPMTPPNLSFKERQALPQLSPGIPNIGSAAYTENQLQRIEDQKQNPWGTAENHPGFLGKVGHVASRVGNIAADILAPGIALNVPGSDINRKFEEDKLKAELASRTKGEEEGQTRQVQNAEAQQRLTKAQNEQSLEKDAEGNITGWKDPEGKLHALDEEGTPQAIKDIAEATQNKPHIEKGANGDIVQITPGKNGEPTKSEVVYKGNPKVETDLVQRSINGQEHHVLVNKQTGEDIKDLGAFKTEPNPAKQAAQDKIDEEIVIGYDKNGQQKLMSHKQAREEGLDHIVKSSDKDRGDALQNAAALNDMGAKVKNMVKSSEGLDKLGSYQKSLVQTALQGHPDDMTTRLAVSLMDPLAKAYYTDVFSLREAALALPKQTTGGSRVSEPQATALFNTIPGSAGDHKLRLMQLRKFDENLGRLWRKVPAVEGTPQERPFSAEENKGGGAGGGPPREPRPGFKWQQNKKTGEYREVPSPE